MQLFGVLVVISSKCLISANVLRICVTKKVWLVYAWPANYFLEPSFIFIAVLQFKNN